MTRDEAVAVLRELIEAIEDDQAYSQLTRGMYKDGYRRIDAYKTAIAALREQGQGYTMTADRLPDGERLASKQGWVRTSERVPTEADGDTHMVLCGWLVPPFNGNESFYAYELSTKHAVCNNPKHHPLWMSLPALPEVGE